MKTPTAPQSGAPVTANWGREVCDALRRQRLQAGPGIRLSQTPEGTTISAPGSTTAAPAASGETVVAKITGGTTLTGYDVTCYPAYPATTGSYAGKMAVPEIALGTELPVNTYIIAHKKAVEIMGGTPA